MAAANVDTSVERAGRWVARRMTRRSFLGRFGRAAVFVASGPAIATLLADDAEARVCGQTGVSPLCPTFDCNDIWGWCWYATGCCSEGRLKKICDCCAVNWPNVHGYCPAGTNVRCIVESCGTDPRVQRVDLLRMRGDTHLAIAAQVRNERYRGGAPTAVLGDITDPLQAAVSTAFGGIVGGPILHVHRHALHETVIGELRRLRVRMVYIVGSMLPLTIDGQLQEAGIPFERVGLGPETAPWSGEVAQWVASRLGPRNVVCIEDHGISAQSAPIAAAFANATRLPLTIGTATARAGRGIYLVGPEAARAQAQHHGSLALHQGSLPALADALAAIGRHVGVPAHTAVLAPHGWPGQMALAGLGYPIVLHQPGTLDWARNWVFHHRGPILKTYVAGTSGSLGTASYKELQSILNGFETHMLIGVAGQGLPVYDQPVAERPPGRARLGTDPPPPRRGSKWTRRSRRRRRRRRRR